MNYPKTEFNDSRLEVTQEGRYKGLLFGLLAYIIFEYIRFGVWIPGLSSLHLQKIIAIITLICFVISYKDPIQHPRFLLCFLVIIVISTFANYGNLSRARALYFFITIAKITATYYLIINLLIERENLKKFLFVYLFCNIVLVLSGIIVGGYKGALSGGIFAEGFVSDSNDFALAINVVLPFFWYLFVYQKKPIMKIILILAILLCLITVIYTFSRGGFVGLGAVLLYIVITSKYRIKNFFILASLIGAGLMFTPSGYLEQMQTITQFQEEGPRSTSQMRLNLSKIGIIMTLKNPFFGVGPLNFPYQIVNYGTEVLPDESELKYLAGRIAHNVFITVSSELGFLGLLCFIAFFFIAYKNALYSQKKLDSIELRENFWLRSLPPAIKASLVGYGVTSLFLTSYTYPHIYLISALSSAIKHNAFNNNIQ